MDELMDLMVSDESPSQISDKIKDVLYSKSADKIQGIRPDVASQLFDKDIDLDNPEPEAELDQDIELSGVEEPAEEPVEQAV
tara:strand:+ start:550 stop:795 length:246 start_codon:yes stop_codon:yes gene_type:complete